MQRYENRKQAGCILASILNQYAKQPNTLVLGLARGGMPVAYEVAKALELPLEVFIVRKLGVPGHEELALGAIASGGAVVFNEEILRGFHLSENEINSLIAHEEREIKRREQSYRGNRPFPALRAKTIILIDDGIATGATLRAGIKALREFHPMAIVVAVPVAAVDSCEQLRNLVDEFYCPLQPPYFSAVGEFYEDFSQTTDEEVRACFNRENG